MKKPLRSFSNVSLTSPNKLSIFGLPKTGLSILAYPAVKLHFITIIYIIFHTLSTKTLTLLRYQIESTHSLMILSPKIPIDCAFLVKLESISIFHILLFFFLWRLYVTPCAPHSTSKKQMLLMFPRITHLHRLSLELYSY